MTDAEYIKTIPTLTNKELLEELDYCGYDSYYRTIREPVIEEITKRLNRIAELEKENAELKADNDARKFAMAMSEKVEKQLREENVELKEKLNFSTQYYQGEKAKEQLTKAKNALKKFVDFANGERTIPVKWIAEAEQFIKESE